MTSSVVILSYQPGEWLAEAVGSVVDQADEVVVVDNGSRSAEASLIARRAGARVVRSERNLGFAGGVNLGVASTTGDVIALLNDDAVAGAEWLQRAEEVLADPDVAAVGPKIRLAAAYREVLLPDHHVAPADHRSLGRRLRSVTVEGVEVIDELLGGLYAFEESDGDRWRWSTAGRPWYVPLPAAATDEGAPVGGIAQAVEVLIDGQVAPRGATCRLINSAGVYLRPDGYAGDVGLGAPDDGRFDQRQDRFALSGTALVLRAETWHRIGPLASPFFAYYEDIDWCWRANLAGLRLVYDPAASVDHRRSATSGGASAVRVMAERNRTLSMVRNGPLPKTLAALAQRWKEGSDGGVREAIARQLPWAIATRLSGWAWRSAADLPAYRKARALWAGGVRPAPGAPTATGRTRAGVWRQWAGIDNAWDDSPVRPG
ncbi:MAG: glycosyltransferase family 2 protein [Acidimicrobiaceae bacterium]|nr:glycosyltransferase family 2 protein [Acidimicrobiaceae bacterium]MBO0747534.1 glycosyltransferase family 2 protein [Acidimicrobiaceae bacterium]